MFSAPAVSFRFLPSGSVHSVGGRPADVLIELVIGGGAPDLMAADAPASDWSTQIYDLRQLGVRVTEGRFQSIGRNPRGYVRYILKSDIELVHGGIC